jgi:hypothetical protein
MLKAQEKGEADFADLLVKLKKGTGFWSDLESEDENVLQSEERNCH